MRLAKEAEERERARVAEEERRAVVRAALAERAAIERKLLDEKEAIERVERERVEAEAAAELARKRERDRVAAEAEAARRTAQCEARGETTKSFAVSAAVSFDYRAGRGDIAVEVRARAGISSPGVETGVFLTSEAARNGALSLCSAAARAAMLAYSSDMRLKQMMGDPCPLGVASGGFDDVEFDHWMRVAQVRRCRLPL